MQKQVYGTIRRVLSNGENGTPWIAELMPHEDTATVFVEMSRRPTAAVGDDLLVNADIEQHPDGRQIGRVTGFSASEKEAFARLLAATSDAKPVEDWKVISRIAAARRNRDAAVRLTDDALCVIRPTVAPNSTLETLARHSRNTLVSHDAPRYLVNPLLHAAASADPTRIRAAEPAGLADRLEMSPGPSFANVGNMQGDNWGSVIDPGGVDRCSYTTLMQVSGRGLLSKRDVSANLHHEFVTAHEYGHTLDTNDRSHTRMDAAEVKRRQETFADAFAVTELALSGRSLAELDQIIAAREAAIVGAAFLESGKRLDMRFFVHVSGAAARVALNGARKALESGIPVSAADIVGQARRISDDWTISKDGIQDLAKALRTLPANADHRTITAWLDRLASKTSDKALKFNAESLKTRLGAFYTPGQHASVANKIAAIHAGSMRKHLDYLTAQGLGEVDMQVLVSAEKMAWGIPEQTGLQRVMGRIGIGSSGLPALLRANIETIAKNDGSKKLEAPQGIAFVRIPEPKSDMPNPWTFSVSDRLQRAATYGESAYRTNASVAQQGTPSHKQEEAFANAMRGLSAFAEAVTLRDPTKDSKSVRRILDGNPDLEDNLKVFSTYKPGELTLPLAEGKRLHLQSVIQAINPRVVLDEIAAPAAPNPFAEFANDVALAGDRD